MDIRSKQIWPMLQFSLTGSSRLHNDISFSYSYSYLYAVEFSNRIQS